MRPPSQQRQIAETFKKEYTSNCSKSNFSGNDYPAFPARAIEKKLVYSLSGAAVSGSLCRTGWIIMRNIVTTP